MPYAKYTSQEEELRGKGGGGAAQEGSKIFGEPGNAGDTGIRLAFFEGPTAADGL